MIGLFISPPALSACSSEQVVKKVRVVKVAEGRIALKIGGRLFPISKNFEKADSIGFVVESSPESTIQNVFIWEELEFRDLENELGKYYSLHCHRLEIDPGHPDLSLLEGASLSFWGHRSEVRGVVRFEVTKINGLPALQKPTSIHFERAK